MVNIGTMINLVNRNSGGYMPMSVMVYSTDGMDGPKLNIDVYAASLRIERYI